MAIDGACWRWMAIAVTVDNAIETIARRLSKFDERISTEVLDVLPAYSDMEYVNASRPSQPSARGRLHGPSRERCKQAPRGVKHLLSDRL